jgi:hypothetical protein
MQAFAANPLPMPVAAAPAGIGVASAVNEVPSSVQTAVADDPGQEVVEIDPDAEVVLAYCAAVRGILNDDQGGPLDPPGLRMAEALQEVKESMDRNVAAQKGGRQKDS